MSVGWIVVRWGAGTRTKCETMEGLVCDGADIIMGYLIAAIINIIDKMGLLL